MAALWGDTYNFGDIPPDDLVALWNDGTMNEIWEGRLVQETMTYPLHGLVANTIGYVFMTHLLQQGITASVGQHILFNVTQPGSPRTILAPDVAILPVGSVILPRTIPTFAPWLAVEILSPSQTMTHMHLKAQAYLRAGSAEVWIVDPEQMFVEVITTQGTMTYQGQQRIVSTVLSGFTPTVQDLIP